mmetsp:Transcript_49954/g.117678  ORF Transcript_49954/g.117678 Transcript_49954/m.117678 type:complete len:275 (+) Transcript_49954:197-1021(+)
MAEVHVIGEIVGARGVGSPTTSFFRLGGGQSLWCRWEICVENNGRWSKKGGAVREDDDAKPYCVDQEGHPVPSEFGETQVCLCKPGGEALWAHPIDVHYSTTSYRGWPRMLLEVWSQDLGGRNELAGYGIAHIPAAPGVYDMDVPLWRPVASIARERWWPAGIWAGFKGLFLGIWPRLNDGINPKGYSQPSAAKDMIQNLATERTNMDGRRNLETVGTGCAQVKLSVITRGFVKLGPGTSPQLDAELERRRREKAMDEDKLGLGTDYGKGRRRR